MNYWMYNYSEFNRNHLAGQPNMIYMAYSEKECPNFYNGIKQGDVIIVTEGAHINTKLYFVGLAYKLDRVNQCWSLIRTTKEINNKVGQIIRGNPDDFPGRRSDSPWGPFRSIIKLTNNPAELRVKEVLNSFYNIFPVKNNMYQTYITLLKSTHNLILTGAPGTGKTYLAKEIAKAMGCTDDEICFVQFHPSYDYTDFVEGLRPIQDENGSVGFERRDGVFKDFCAKALKNYLESVKKTDEIQSDEIFDIVYSSLVDDIEDGIIQKYETPRTGLLDVFLTSKRQIVFFTKANTKKYIRADYLKALFDYVKDKNINLLSLTKEQLDELVAKTTDIEHVDHVQYRWTLHQLVSRYKKLQRNVLDAKAQKVEKKNFVFIIDEINRGEISKIFGELFFSIDPGYRGKDGMVETQYQNMIEDGDTFKKGFFVPDNVYIIGTMNDIDRSVESMDFAFRRRFAFKEVTAQESQNMLDSEEAWEGKKPDETTIQIVKGKMDSLNKMIWHKPTDGEQDEDKSVDGLSAAYHIGASYFLKLANYKNADGSFDFDQLWEYHLEGLLFEYLRGTTEIYKKIKKLAQAYGYTKADKYE